MFDLWPHQRQGIEDFMRLTEQGERSILLTSPTGGGKSRIMLELMQRFSSCVVYSNRNVLTGQLIDTLNAEGIQFGVRAAEYVDDLRLGCPIQISSMPTEEERVYKQNKWELHKAALVLVDEAHTQKSAGPCKILADHQAQNAVIGGITATPMGISHIYKRLIVAGRNSELRNCGAHVLCRTFNCGELDTSLIKPTVTGEFKEGDIIKKVWTPAIFGHVVEHYRKLNPEQKPAICNCPSVATAVWMAEQFNKEGIPAASLDGKEIVVHGRREKSDQDSRKRLMAMLDSGEIKIITFRYILREAWDFPKLYHLILATPIGSLTSYLQVVGRLLRAHDSLDHVILQDHGGNYWRHGSPNADRDWESLWRLRPDIPGEMRMEALREKKEEEPITCPQCKAVRHRGITCHHCGYQTPRKTRQIIQHDGTLTEIEGDIVKPHRVRLKPDTEQLWEQCYHRCRKTGRTFRQARGLFFYEHHYYPPNNLKLMPQNLTDWWERVDKVPTSCLN